MYSLDAGRLNKRVQIYGYQDVLDELGQHVTSLNLKHADVWAEIHPLRAYERVEANQTADVVTYRIIIRYKADVTQKDVLVRGDRQFDITGMVDIDEQHVALELTCVERKDRVILHG
jgi:SPP1 family predicted phage head-tail adaptor